MLFQAVSKGMAAEVSIFLISACIFSFSSFRFETVKRLYAEFLSGKTPDYIKRIFEREGVQN